jgi:hypothetical protein
MFSIHPMRVLPQIALALLLTAALACAAQSSQPLPLKPSPPVHTPNRRLILKDGNYQVVRRYEVVEDRVRYLSAERSDDWEELPVELVDWEATHKWERDQANPRAAEPLPAMKEAEAIDKEDAEEREERKAQCPEVAQGLALPNKDAVFALDRFGGAPQLVELAAVDLAVDGKLWHGLNTLNPLAASKAQIKLAGAHAKVHLHTSSLAIYLSLVSRDDAGTDQTSASSFAIVRAEERDTVRNLSAIHFSRTGTISLGENAAFATVEALPGKLWLKITPPKPLPPGEYALVEIITASEMSQTAWEFSVDPASGANQGAIGANSK